MEVIYAFADKPDAAKYTALAKSADKLGLNVQLFLDLLPAVVFVDAVLGSLTCQVDSTSQARPHHCSADLKVLINLLTAELEAMPDRHASRRLAADRGYKQAIKEVMTEAGLSPEIVFALLVIPIGPARGRVMEKIYALVRDPESTVDFGQHQQELRERAFRARQLLADRHLSI
jgi:hypothetical protein